MGFDERYRHDGRDDHDEWLESLAARHGVDAEVARDILAAARRESAEDRYRRSVPEWFEMLVAMRGPWLPAPGTRPRGQGYRHGSARGIGEPAKVAPGHRTQVQVEAQRLQDRHDALARQRAREATAGVHRAGDASQGEHRADDASQAEHRADDASRGEHRERDGAQALHGDIAAQHKAAPRPRPLDAWLQQKMGSLFGHDFSEVEVHVGSPEATGSTRAIARDGEIHFRDGAYQPGTSDGDRLIAHELAHVVQQRRPGGRSGGRRELEREADVAATLVARGLAAPIAFGAPAGASYAFDDSEDHGGGEVDEVADDGVDADGIDVEGVDADGGEHAEADAEKKTEGDPDGGGSAGTHAADSAQAAAQPAQGEADDAESGDGPSQAEGGEVEPGDHPEGDDADGDDGADIDPQAELAAAGAPVAAEDVGGGGGGAGGGGGGAAAKPDKEAPAVAGAKPEVGLGQLKGVRPDKVAGALGEVHAAAATDVDKVRAKNQANPPKQMSTGGAAGAKAAKGAGAAKPGAAGAGATGTRAGAHDDKPVKAEVPGGQAAKQAQQGEAKQEQKSAGQVIDTVVQAISSWFGSFIGGAAGEGEAGKMSDAEGQQMAGSIDRASTSASDISTDPGPAPDLEMKGEAKAGADQDRADLEAKTAQLEDKGRADSRVPMGEDSIETSVPVEELSAKAVDGGTPGEAALPTVAGSASSEEVGIIAQEEHGAEIDAALTRASADVAAERGKHAQEDVKARADADKQVSQLKTQADADQAAARSAAKTDVEKARGEWKGEIDRKGADARKQADKKVSEGMVEVETEQTKANEEAKKHVDEAKDKADAEKQKGEKEAADAKEKGKKKSSGFGGWLASKAKSLFDGIKKAISSAIDAARKAVKAVIDAAKKLAMAAIELARKAIVAVIKAIGKALIAISDVLLAAFPELKAKFQKAINGLVDKAVKAVNKLAEGLKKAVQKALDLLGAVLDKALQLLEKGLHFIVDAANAVVQAAIKAAEAIAAALGTWIKLIKDVAKGPGSWIGKMGAAVVDGIKNHLWGAFKTAVVEWFKSKVMELLGVGGILLSILLEGGINTDDIVKMAMDALIVAIPIALVAILIEKLVAMIVPAAGAVMAIIEGLQAAWGTISRIIAAFGAFMAFLQAVQGGGAGPLFATALAAAAIVLLDFVSNWLLRKLAGPARKVGARLKGMGDKFKRRGSKGAKGPKAKPKAHAKPTQKGNKVKDGPHAKGKGPKPTPKKKPVDKKKTKDTKDKDKKKEETLAQKEARLRRAVAETKKLMGSRSRLSLILRLRLALIRRKHKLTTLEATKKGSTNAWDVVAKINPEARFDLFSIEDDAADLRKAVGAALSSLSPTASIGEVKSLCARSASTHLAAGYKLDWQHMSDSWVLFLERPGHKIPRTAVGEFRKANEYTVKSKLGDQTLFSDVDNKELVHDSAQQHVPRILNRNITKEDAKALKKKKGISATGPKSRVDIWEHVAGAKPSPYISTTKLEDADIENPHGEPLGGEHGRVRIDLLHVSPKKIFDLTTKKGQDQWQLSNPKTPTRRQVLEDVIRTQEVLIKGEIPPDAIEKF